METGIELVVRVLVGAAIRPSVGRPPTTCLLPESGFSDQCADDLVEGLGLAGLVVQAGAPADQRTADDGGRAARAASLSKFAKWSTAPYNWTSAPIRAAQLSDPEVPLVDGAWSMVGRGALLPRPRKVRFKLEKESTHP